MSDSEEDAGATGAAAVDHSCEQRRRGWPGKRAVARYATKGRRPEPAQKGQKDKRQGYPRHIAKGEAATGTRVFMGKPGTISEGDSDVSMEQFANLMAREVSVKATEAARRAPSQESGDLAKKGKERHGQAEYR